MSPAKGLISLGVLVAFLSVSACSDRSDPAAASASASALWWQRGIVYQIYPRSFQDTDRDGIGDLAGISKRLDYLKWLGVDAVWISPVYPSPMADFGYDVSDYINIHPMFGQLADFDRLVEAAHERGLKVILDFVPNHTSDQHPWFVEARSSRSSPKRNWYVWRDAVAGGTPPNNWLAVFGGSAWEWDAASRQYYYHAFLKEQPDLNWRNPDVEQHMFDVMRFWLSRGVDGFRVDVIYMLLEDEQFQDNPRNPEFRPGMLPYFSLAPVHTEDQPDGHAVIRRMRRVVNEYPARVLIGEVYGPRPLQRLVSYYGANKDETHLPFNFQLIDATWDAKALAELIGRYEAALPVGAWPNWVLGNHDQHRVVTRLGLDQARVAAMLLLTLRGTPTMYYADELGLPDAVVPPDRIQDPLEKRQPSQGFGRDPERSPMPWDQTENAGFSAGIPWLPLVENWRALNVESQRSDSASMLSLYRQLIALRRSEPALELGDYLGLGATGSVLAYLRQLGDSRFLVVLNLGSTRAEFAPDRLRIEGEIVITTQGTRAGERIAGLVRLSSREGVVIRLQS